jgi:hypothetical protein
MKITQRRATRSDVSVAVRLPPHLQRRLYDSANAQGRRVQDLIVDALEGAMRRRVHRRNAPPDEVIEGRVTVESGDRSSLRREPTAGPRTRG